MDYRKFYFTRAPFKITHTKTEYAKTASGKSWRAVPVSETTETVTAKFYENFVQSIPFFDGFFGGTCRAQFSYTAAGYIPVKIVTVNPDGTQKFIDTFTFDYIGG